MKEYIDTGKKDTRSGFGAGLALLGDSNPKVVAMTADLKGSLKMDAFAAAHPDRFFDVGIAEANMVGMAAGLAIAGYIPFIGTFANFATARVLDQIRQSVCYSRTNVKIAASHAGITLGEDGATHQTLEDIGLMRQLPGMVVLNPCDYNQTQAATLAAAAWNGPVYLRFGRPGVPNFTPADQPFEIGKAIHLQRRVDFRHRSPRVGSHPGDPGAGGPRRQRRSDRHRDHQAARQGSRHRFSPQDRQGRRGRRTPDRRRTWRGNCSGARGSVPHADAFRSH